MLVVVDAELPLTEMLLLPDPKAEMVTVEPSPVEIWFVPLAAESTVTFELFPAVTVCEDGVAEMVKSAAEELESVRVPWKSCSRFALKEVSNGK